MIRNSRNRPKESSENSEIDVNLRLDREPGATSSKSGVSAVSIEQASRSQISYSVRIAADPCCENGLVSRIPAAERGTERGTTRPWLGLGKVWHGGFCFALDRGGNFGSPFSVI